jgi:hypothetical protein
VSPCEFIAQGPWLEGSIPILILGRDLPEWWVGLLRTIAAGNRPRVLKVIVPAKAGRWACRNAIAQDFEGDPKVAGWEEFPIPGQHVTAVDYTSIPVDVVMVLASAIGLILLEEGENGSDLENTLSNLEARISACCAASVILDTTEDAGVEGVRSE